MKKLTFALLLTTALAGPALAQQDQQQQSAQDMAEKRQAAELDQKYKNAIKRSNVETQQTRIDPWANMRGTEAPPKR